MLPDMVQSGSDMNNPPDDALDHWIRNNLTTEDILKIPGVLPLVRNEVITWTTWTTGATNDHRD